MYSSALCNSSRSRRWLCLSTEKMSGVSVAGGVPLSGTRSAGSRGAAAGWRSSPRYRVSGTLSGRRTSCMSCGHPCCNRVIIWRNVAAGYSRMYCPSCGLSCDTLIPLQTGFMVQIFRTHSGLPGDEGDLSRACNVSVTGSPFWWFLTSSSRPFPQYSRLPLRLVSSTKKQRPFPGAYSFSP